MFDQPYPFKTKGKKTIRNGELLFSYSLPAFCIFKTERLSHAEQKKSRAGFIRKGYKSVQETLFV